MSYEKHEAEVVSIEDPERRGRIQVSCVGIMGDDEEPVPGWVEPLHSWGWFVVPDIGEIVEIEIVADVEGDEGIGQASISNPDLRWRSSKRFWGNLEAEEGQGKTEIPPEFLTNYGKRRGFATPQGHILIFDDTKGDLQVSMSWKGPAGISSATFDANGSLTMQTHAGQTVKLDAENDRVDVTAPTVAVNAEVVDLGGGAGDFALLGNAFLALFAGHTHPTGVGLSGPAQAGPSVPTAPWESALSTIVRVKG